MPSFDSFGVVVVYLLLLCHVECYYFPAGSLFHAEIGKSSGLGSQGDDVGSKDTSYKLIKTQSEVVKAVEYLKSCSEVSLDLEFDRDRFAYGTTLSLVQVKGHSDEIYLMDALADIDLDPFFRNVVENPSIVKVIHAASEDIRIIRLSGYACRTVFDTERSAKLLDFPFTSLAKVVQNLLEIPLDKGEQTSNWIKRPLTKKQCVYAAQDVLHLQAVKSKMIKIAEEMGTIDFIVEENLAWDDYRLEEKDESNLVSKKDSMKFSAYELHVYNALLKRRDYYARKVDKPPQFVIPKDILMDIAMMKNENQPLTFYDKKGVHPAIKKRAVENEFSGILDSARAAASELNLSKMIPKRLDSAEDKVSVLNSMYPSLHQHLVQKYGLNTANHILPNKLATELATERKTIDDIEYAYKRKIFADFEKRGSQW